MTFFVAQGGWTRIQLQALPKAAKFVISDQRGPMSELEDLVRVSLVAVAGHFVKMGMERGCN